MVRSSFARRDSRRAAGSAAHRARRRARPALAGLIALALAGATVASVATPEAGAVVVRAANGHLYGVLYRSVVEASHRPHRRHARGETPPEPLNYNSTEGGAVMLKTKVYPIFWAPAGHEFPSGYEATIEQYLQDIAHSSTLGLVATNDWSIPTQYTNGSGEHISEAFEYGEALHDTTAYPGTPEANCPGDKVTETPCLSDAQVQAEVKADVKAKGWPTNAPGKPEDQYLVFFPPNVEGCSEPEGKGCTYSGAEGGYCGYHSSFETERESGQWLVYSNIPSIAGCASGQAPEGVKAPVTEAQRKEVDGTLDTLNHELAESATDPLTENRIAWMTPIKHLEIGDLCTQPVVEATESIYGIPLGGSFEGDTAFNELINEHQYYVQTLWSNAPTKTPALAGSPPAGCLQRMGPTPQFKAPEHLQAQLAATFNAEGSYDAQDPITQYEWSFGDGTPVVKSTTPTVSHVFKSNGTYEVSLTVSDVRGATYASTEKLTVTPAAAEEGHPEAEFSYPATITAGEQIEFNASATKDAKNTVDRYEWSFGDGSAPVVSSEPTVKHVFATGGEYAVSLTVTDMSNKSDKIEKRVKVASSESTSTTTTSTHTTSTSPSTSSTSTTTTATVATHSTTTASTSSGHKARRRLRLAGREIVRGREALLRVSCPAGSGCSGRVVLLAPARLLAHGRHAKKRGLMRVTSARYTIKAGRTLTLRILLPAKLARLLGRGRALVLTVRILEAGGAPGTARLTLREGKPSKRRALRRRRARRRR